jgi:vacuolar-type H+-ATPase catalytic subunit A/Vma1
MQPLSVQLGPGLLGNIFDGIQRPLKAIAQRSGDVFIPRGVAVPALDETASWEFAPTTFKVCVLGGGACVGGRGGGRGDCIVWGVERQVQCVGAWVCGVLVGGGV